MPRLVIALGAAMLLGGLAAVAFGLPYVVLEFGFTQVIAGSVVATGGLVLIVLGLLLREVRGLRAGLASTAGDGGGTLVAGAALATAGAAGLAGAAALGAASAAASEEQDEALQPLLPFDQEPVAAEAPSETGILAGDAGSTDAAGEEATASAEIKTEAEAVAVAEPEAGPAGDDEETPEPARAEPADAEAPEALPEDGGEAGGETGGPEARQDPAEEPMPPDTFEALRRTLRQSIAASDVEEPDGKGEAAGDPPFRLDVPPEPAVEEKPTETGPVTSEEGIVSVKRIGETTYTMYADGSIKADTPEGEKRFDSVVELKARLAAGEKV